MNKNIFGFFEPNAVPVLPIERLTLDNTAFRRVYSTTEQQQLVFMAIHPGEEIGSEVHEFNTQFIRIESGRGLAIVKGVEYDIRDGDAVTIPANTVHNIINLSLHEMLKLYTIYAPPKHAPGLVQQENPMVLAPYDPTITPEEQEYEEEQEEKEEEEEVRQQQQLEQEENLQ